MKLIRFFEEIDLAGYTVIIPSVSVGNVGQLTVDLIVTTYKLKKVGVLWHPATIPTVGSDPYYTTNETCSACELYVSEALKLAVIQLRSGLEPPLANAFFNCLKETLLEVKIKNVLILSSSFAYEMHTVGSGFFKYISNEDNEKLFEGLDIAKVEPDIGGRYVIHGSGFGTKLYECLGSNIQTTLLVKYCSEGDNIPDALAVLGVLIKLVDFNTKKLDNLVWPSSWSYVYGNPPPIHLY